MKRVYLVFWILVTLLQSGCFAQTNVPSITNPGQLQEAQESWDFGPVKEGLILEHDFLLKNESANTLNIKGVNTSCGCTVSQVEKNTLLPGEETLISVRFNTAGYQGPVQQYVYVNTDSPINPILKFAVQAEVIKSAGGPYAVWDFGEVKEGEILKHNFEFKNDSPKTLNIIQVKTTCGCTVSKIQKNNLLPQESTLLEVQFNSKGFSGQVEKTIYVQTDDLDKPLFVFIIKGKVIK